MLKILPPGGYDFGIEPVSLIKVSSRGLIGDDLKALEKRASHAFSGYDFKDMVRPGEALVHAIAVGAHEYYGPNRKGDTFKEACCREYHPTFVEHGRVFRHHLNKNPKISYGLIKASAYNEDAHRIELIMSLPLTEKAASAMGVLLPERELELLHSGESIPVSMSCYVDHDICPACGGRFKKRADYCGPEECPKYGGLKYNLGKTFDDGFTLYADSQKPVFFDISFVSVPADRTAYTTELLAKAASLFEEPEEAPDWVCDAVLTASGAFPSAAMQREVINKLASLEAKDIEAPYSYIPSGVLSEGSAGLEKAAAYSDGWNALVASNVLLPLPVFCRIHGLDTEGVDMQKTAAAIFRTLKSASIPDSVLEANPFVEDLNRNYNSGRIKSLAPESCLDRELLAKSASVAACGEGRSVKRATPADLNEKEATIATAYGLYQVGFICSRKAAGLDQDEEAIVSWNRS